MTMRLILTTDILRQHNACVEGVDEFHAAYPSRLDIEWTKDRQIELIKTCSVFRKHLFDWAYVEGLVPVFSMRRANLRGAILSGSILSNSNLSGSDLRGSNLRGALLPDGFTIDPSWGCKR